jgi:hypothetical protein
MKTIPWFLLLSSLGLLARSAPVTTEVRTADASTLPLAARLSYLQMADAASDKEILG